MVSVSSLHWDTLTTALLRLSAAHCWLARVQQLAGIHGNLSCSSGQQNIRVGVGRNPEGTWTMNNHLGLLCHSLSTLKGLSGSEGGLLGPYLG